MLGSMLSSLCADDPAIAMATQQVASLQFAGQVDGVLITASGGTAQRRVLRPNYWGLQLTACVAMASV